MCDRVPTAAETGRDHDARVHARCFCGRCCGPCSRQGNAGGGETEAACLRYGSRPVQTVRAVRGLPFLEKDVDSVYGNPTFIEWKAERLQRIRPFVQGFTHAHDAVPARGSGVACLY
jgi:hypothetical protein